VFATTPEPPYVAVIFTSVHTGDDSAAYGAAAVGMMALAARQPGYLGFETAGGGAGATGISVSYWATEDDARAWKSVAAHAEAQRMGRDRWYDRYVVRVATVGRAYGMATGGPDDGTA
jgi:heme-degrading monooxygenase HmoA